MATLYITEQGATISKVDERIVVRKGDQVLQDIPAIKLDQIVILGNAQLTTQLVKFLLDKHIDVAYLSSWGKYRGRLQPAFAKDALLRQAQYAKAAHPQTCLAIAKSIVMGKMANAMTFCQRQRQQNGAVQAALTRMESLRHQVPQAKDLDTIRGYEGSASSTYYEAFRQFLKGDFSFSGRVHHPPPDPINILLSLGYTLLYNHLYTAINLVGFDPYQGFFHQTRHGHATLASDLMEEWRTIIVDSVVLSLVNRQEITPKDFTQKKQRVMLSRAGLQKFLQRYDARVSTEVFHPLFKQKTSYLRCFELQVRHLASVLLGKEKTYLPFRAR